MRFQPSGPFDGNKKSNKQTTKVANTLASVDIFSIRNLRLRTATDNLAHGWICSLAAAPLSNCAR